MAPEVGTQVAACRYVYAPKRLLVPVDFSEGSDRALAFAVELAVVGPGRVDVVHVWQPPTFVSPDLMVFAPDAESISLEDWVRAEAERCMKKFLDGTSPPPKVLEIAPRLEQGDPVDVIIRLAEELESDLVVMSTHGRTGMSRLLAGSVAEQVVRQARCPVLTLPPLRDQ